jgi:hypothetical protein
MSAYSSLQTSSRLDHKFGVWTCVLHREENDLMHGTLRSMWPRVPRLDHKFEERVQFYC